MALVLRAPWITVCVSDSAAGESVRDHLTQRHRRLVHENRYCQGVLALPATVGEYARGPHRRTLRNNLRRARADGVRCETLTSPEVGVRAFVQILHARRAPVAALEVRGVQENWPEVLARPGVMAFAARDVTGDPVGLIAALVDEEVALIFAAVASSHTARWALHQHMVEQLIDLRVRHVFAIPDGPLGALSLTPELRYFQRLLGYEIGHLRVKRASRRRSARRGARVRLGSSDGMDAAEMR